VKVACLGIAQSVKDQQSASGVKDVYTQYWIDSLIERARAMHKAHPTRSISDIQTELMLWVEANKEAIYNSFLKMDATLVIAAIHFCS
jgi:hypothetical protein